MIYCPEVQGIPKKEIPSGSDTGMDKAVLLLEDGTFFAGSAFGRTGTSAGEVVFNTAMTGYQETLTDPSYNGQIVAMTYPLIGNYGFNGDDVESARPRVEGFVVKELCDGPSNWRSTTRPADYFRNHGIVGIRGVDTRALTQHLRSFGSMFGIISSERGDADALMREMHAAKARKRDLVAEVCTKEPRFVAGPGKRLAVLDFGVKESILRRLSARGCALSVLPAFSSPEEVLACEPDGIVLSNGPGDPRDIPSCTATVRALLGTRPILGICLGHQILGLALGGETYKLPFGHHGGNHPVKNLITGRCAVTSQNHNYALRPDFCGDAAITHVNVNDGTVEGFRHTSLPILSVQFHPEAAPGPQDSASVFDDFLSLVENAHA